MTQNLAKVSSLDFGNSSRLSILIVSCDKYSDIWPTFFAFFWNYWSDCPFPVYLGANQKSFDDIRIRMLYTGPDFNWAKNTRTMLAQIDTPYVIMLLEDFFLKQHVLTTQINYFLDGLKQLKGGYLRLKPFPKPDLPVQAFPDIGEISPGAPYRSALQAAIWEKETLVNLLKPGESAWDMEIYGSRRSDRLPVGFYSTWETVINYEAGVCKGKWLPWAVKQSHHVGVPVDLEIRSMLKPLEYLNWQRRVKTNSIINTISWKKRRPLSNLLRKLRILPPRSSI